MKKALIIAILTCSSIVSTAFTDIKEPITSVSKSLIFPVAGSRSNIGSFWGARRSGGRRKHKGIDIFAKKGTPVVAVCDGIITSSGTSTRGGKDLWLQSSRYPWRAYYAHLDQKKVSEGQFVKKGQVLGTVGNTGNAKYTPSHLHFGIYKTAGGAVNPLPYVKNSPKIAVKSTAVKSGGAVVKSNVGRRV